MGSSPIFATTWMPLAPHSRSTGCPRWWMQSTGGRGGARRPPESPSRYSSCSPLFFFGCTQKRARETTLPFYDLHLNRESGAILFSVIKIPPGPRRERPVRQRPRGCVRSDIARASSDCRATAGGRRDGDSGDRRDRRDRAWILRGSALRASAL